MISTTLPVRPDRPSYQRDSVHQGHLGLAGLVWRGVCALTRAAAIFASTGAITFTIYIFLGA